MTLSRLVSQKRIAFDPQAVNSGRWSACATDNLSNPPYPAGYSVVTADAECLERQLRTVWERVQSATGSDEV